MTAIALLLLAVQAPLDVTASVDRTRLEAGDEVLLTVRARSASRDVIRIDIPPPPGFTLVGSRERTEVSLSGGSRPLRTTVRELRLRAERPGRTSVVGITARQGSRAFIVDPIVIQVEGGTPGGRELSAVARALVDRAPAPGSDAAAVLILSASADSVYAAQQLDIVAIAWFPRELRLRLRRPPVVGFRTPDGVWAYPLFASGEVATSRRVRGRWFDAFVAHQVAFPIQAGRVVVEPATADFAMPVSYSFFSREDRYTLRSDSLGVIVRPLPEAGRPTGDRAVAGRDLTLGMRLEPADARVGEPLDVVVTIAGAGNVALWPEPDIRWPAAFRTYPGETSVNLEPGDGHVGGEKTFHSLVVPDSVGVFVLPGIGYPYYDLGMGSYRVARAAAQAVSVGAGSGPSTTRPLPALAAARGPTLARRVVHAADAWVWVVLLALPPLVVAVARRRGGSRGTRGREPDDRGLAALERRFLGVLESHVPDPALRAGSGLAPALRAAGIEGVVADHVLRVRERLRAVRYGPRAGGETRELAAEIRRVLRFLEPDAPRHRVRRATQLVLLLVVAPFGAEAQSAEALYEAGALRAAADSFAARADRAPEVAAHWYNLGATLYRAGADGKATVAWTRAARLAPRDPLVRRARRLLPSPDPGTEALLTVAPLTPAEYGLVALAAWFALWTAVLARRRWWWPAVLTALAVGVAIPGALEWRRRHASVGVVLVSGSAVRAAPYGTANEFGSLPAGVAVRVERRYGAWALVRGPDGMRGWLLRDEISVL